MNIYGVYTDQRVYNCHVKHKKETLMSFYNFLANNYELSKFVLPKKTPVNDAMNDKEKAQLIELMKDKDFYEINTIIRKRYKG